ncbi:DgyrCDS10072 [Dimorphilus gyrociliatus]|uniref:3-dehydrosphinganine reductase n=1 Tax=Dimorphilus gyrociliatus TaxID=2664684 RepID=A0A7I8W150_9ANNE|nr:DgyrCDS10072 [Dimorphilus gyrociliatus]
MTTFLLICIASPAALVVLMYVIDRLISPKKFNPKNAHILITGASSGIGRSLAIEAAKSGAHLTLLARNEARLSETKTMCEKAAKSDKLNILCVLCDITDDYDQIERCVEDSVKKMGNISMLINCAGTSTSGRFDSLEFSYFKSLMDINYMGSVKVTRAALPSIKKVDNGRIVFVSSVAGQVGLFGYTAYSGSKFALRGLAECLQMELNRYNIRITIAHPPDTETPGFEEENKVKPEETRLISEAAKLFQPDEVAKSIFQTAIKGKFLQSIGLDGYFTKIATCGFGPSTSILESAQQVVLLPIVRVVSLCYLYYFRRLVDRIAKESMDKKKQ